MKCHRLAFGRFLIYLVLSGNNQVFLKSKELIETLSNWFYQHPFSPTGQTIEYKMTVLSVVTNLIIRIGSVIIRISTNLCRQLQFWIFMKKSAWLLSRFSFLFTVLNMKLMNCSFIFFSSSSLRKICQNMGFLWPVHRMKSVRIRSFFWSIFSRIQRDTKYLSVFSPNAGKYRPEKSPYLDTFHTVVYSRIRTESLIF